jgi:hypothetical protein
MRETQANRVIERSYKGEVRKVKNSELKCIVNYMPRRIADARRNRGRATTY